VVPLENVLAVQADLGDPETYPDARVLPTGGQVVAGSNLVSPTQVRRYFCGPHGELGPGLRPFLRAVRAVRQLGTGT
jgi:hypothetical protein